MTEIASIGGNPQSMGVKQATGGEEMGKQDFLQLLITQLENQDPMDPSDPEEFSSQLAQFSSLEQMTNINENIQKLSRGMESVDRMSILSMLGKEVVMQEDSFTLDQAPVQLGYELEDPASRVVLEVRNSSGETVSRIEGDQLSPGRHFVSWDGDGLPRGDYSFEVEVQRGEESSRGTALQRSRVTGVEDMESGGSLITESGKIGMEDVLQVRDGSI